MPENFIGYRLPNAIIGFCFCFVGICILWLYGHRRADWPKSWALALLTACFVFCGGSRIAHAFGEHDSNIIIFGDWASAVAGLIGCLLLPHAILVISRLPTPREIEHAIRGNLQKRAAQAEAEREKKRREKAVRQRNLMLALIHQTPTMPPGLKDQLDKLLAELNHDSDPEDSPNATDNASPK